MGANQGLRKLSKGSIRKLTASEVARGYIFITNDKAAQKQLGTEFICQIDTATLKERKIDGYGRIYAGKPLTRELEGKTLEIKFSQKGIRIKTPNAKI